MDNPAMPDEKNLDEKITDFTDQILGAGKETVMNTSEMDDELIRLQKAILQMKAAVDAARPDQDTSERIRRNVLKATQPSFSSRLKSFALQWKIPAVALTGASLLLVLIASLMIYSPESGNQLTGAAENAPGWLPFIILTGIIVIAIITWFNRQR
jgi:hypothetical protein